MGVRFCFRIEYALMIYRVYSYLSRGMYNLSLSVKNPYMGNLSIGIIEEGDITWLRFVDKAER